MQNTVSHPNVPSGVIFILFFSLGGRWGLCLWDTRSVNATCGSYFQRSRVRTTVPPRNTWECWLTTIFTLRWQCRIGFSFGLWLHNHPSAELPRAWSGAPWWRHLSISPCDRWGPPYPNRGQPGSFEQWSAQISCPPCQGAGRWGAPQNVQGKQASRTSLTCCGLTWTIIRGLQRASRLTETNNEKIRCNWCYLKANVVAGDTHCEATHSSHWPSIREDGTFLP